MADTANKVRFGIKNVHYAVLTDGATPSWGTPAAIPGAVSLSLSPEGGDNPFYADNQLYFTVVKNGGYSGDLECALFPADFLKAVFGLTEGATSKVVTESSLVQPKPFALMFEEDGDIAGTKFVLYRCVATRPEQGSQTTADKIEVKTQKMSFKAYPMASDGSVMAYTQETTPEATLTAWYTSVFREA